MTPTTLRPGMKILVEPEKLEASLWRRFKYENNDKARAELFEFYTPHARQLAHKQYYKSPKYGLERGDFEQLAYTGLLEALERFDPTKQVPFIAFAKFRISGSISNGLRGSSEDSSHYTQRHEVERERLRSIRKAPLPQTPPESAINKLSEMAIGLALGLIIESIDNPGEKESVDAAPNAYDTLAWQELRTNLKREITRLPEQENIVVNQHYIVGLAFVQIARLLSITKGRVSQIHRSGIDRLRKRLRSLF